MGTQNVPRDLQETVTGAGWSTQMQLAHDSTFWYDGAAYGQCRRFKCRKADDSLLL